MSTDTKKPEYILPSEAAVIARVSPTTVKHWARAGHLDFVQSRDSGWMMIDAASLARYLADREAAQ